LTIPFSDQPVIAGPSNRLLLIKFSEVTTVLNPKVFAVELMPDKKSTGAGESNELSHKSPCTTLPV